MIVLIEQVIGAGLQSSHRKKTKQLMRGWGRHKEKRAEGKLIRSFINWIFDTLHHAEQIKRERERKTPEAAIRVVKEIG